MSTRIIVMTALGILSALLTVTYFVIYFTGAARAKPQFVVRFSGDDPDNPPLFGRKGYFKIGVSTERSQGAVIRALKVEPLSREPVHFRSNDIFEIEPSRSRICLEWKGEKRLERDHYVIFAVPYDVDASVLTPASVLVSLSMTGSVAPESWGKPWSMFALGNNTTQFVKRLDWKPEPTGGQETGFKIGPLQSIEIFGHSAEEAIEAHSKTGTLNAEVTEIFKDGSYSQHSAHKSPAPSPSAGPQK